NLMIFLGLLERKLRGSRRPPSRPIHGMKDSMKPINRREFGGAVLALGTGAGSVSGAGRRDETLRSSARRRKIPAVVAMAATVAKTTYTAAFGKRLESAAVDSGSDSIFL